MTLMGEGSNGLVFSLLILLLQLLPREELHCMGLDYTTWWPDLCPALRLHRDIPPACPDAFLTPSQAAGVTPPPPAEAFALRCGPVSPGSSVLLLLGGWPVQAPRHRAGPFLLDWAVLGATGQSSASKHPRPLPLQATVPRGPLAETLV